MMNDNNNKNCTTIRFQDVGRHDVIFGKGSLVFNNPGNKKFREFLEENCCRYWSAKRLDKPGVVYDMIHHWHQLDPPGRFLVRKMPAVQQQLIPMDYEYSEVDDKKAVRTIAQRIRERRSEPATTFYNFRSTNEKSARLALLKTTLPSSSQKGDERVFQQRPHTVAPSAMAFPQPPTMRVSPTHIPVVPEQIVVASQCVPLERIPLGGLGQQQPTTVPIPSQEEPRLVSVGHHLPQSNIPHPPMVPLHVLLQRENDIMEKELEVKLLRSALIDDKQAQHLLTASSAASTGAVAAGPLLWRQHPAMTTMVPSSTPLTLSHLQQQAVVTTPSAALVSTTPAPAAALGRPLILLAPPTTEHLPPALLYSKSTVPHVLL